MAKTSGIVLAVSAAILNLSVANAQTTPPPEPNSTAPPAPSVPTLSPPAPTPILFNDALLKAANDLLSKATVSQRSDHKIRLLIDPLIDGVTGAQSVATQSMGRQITELVRKSYPQYDIKSFTATELEKGPLVLIGTFTPINNGGTPNGPKDVYRICLALADLGAKKIISKGVARAKFDGVDVTPTAYFSDSPVFSKDIAVDAYVKSCQGTKPGDPIEQVYVDRISSAAVIADAIKAYDDHKYEQALDLYEKASKIAGGDQLRILNGIYLANWRLQRNQAAGQAFEKLVEYGLNKDRLAVKFLFRKGTTQFVSISSAATPYEMWLKNIATKLAGSKSCLDIIGHASPTGPVSLNDALSSMRAKYVMQRMGKFADSTKDQMIAIGVGSSQNIIGTGRDDASDALDRRVEFKIDSACAAKKKSI